ncbi:MAG: hypothetical protein LQ344_004680 [Seirophora lacunosa]|nr:MAG: hypothetical protein LQ344_004680 [Seirophora lacunosa]
MDLLGGLERVLHGKIKPMITQCSIRHLYTLPVPQAEKDPLILLAKSMERRRCNHHELEDPLSTLECLSSVIDPKKSATNRNRYVVASQEDEVRRFCRSVRGVPLVYVKRSVMIMEPMAESTIGVKEGMEREKFRAGLRRRPTKRKREDNDEKAEGNDDRGNKHDDEHAGGDEDIHKKRSRVRGPKEPNPLSVKKSRKETSGPRESGGIISALALKEPEDLAERVDSIIEHNPESGQPPPGKRKRKRKHKPGKLDDLKDVMAEDGEPSS